MISKRHSMRSKQSNREPLWHHRAISSKSSKQKCAEIGNLTVNVNLAMNAHLHTAITNYYKSSTFRQITGPKSARTSISTCIVPTVNAASSTIQLSLKKSSRRRQDSSTQRVWWKSGILQIKIKVTRKDTGIQRRLVCWIKRLKMWWVSCTRHLRTFRNK